MDEQMIYNRIETILQKMSQKKQLQSLAKSNGIELNELELNDDTTDAVVVSVIALMLAKMDEDERYKKLCDFGMQKRSLKVEIINDYKQRANMLYNKFKNRNNPVEVSITIDGELPVDESFVCDETDEDFVLEAGIPREDLAFFGQTELKQIKECLKSVFDSMQMISDTSDQMSWFKGNPNTDSRAFDTNKQLFVSNNLKRQLALIKDKIFKAQEILEDRDRLVENNPVVSTEMRKVIKKFRDYLDYVINRYVAPVGRFIDNIMVAPKENVIRPGSTVVQYQKEFDKAINSTMSPEHFRQSCNHGLKNIAEFSWAKFDGKPVPNVSI